MATRTQGKKPPADPIDAIESVNAGRVPQLLRHKFDAMAQDRFAFLRATALLGHTSVDLAALPKTPVGWICGDLHLQNFGCFRGANRLVYFDLNDFDEAALLPVSLDLLRFLGSLYTAAPGLGLERGATTQLAQSALLAYASALQRGKAYWLERETATGPIAALLRQVGERKRRTLLAARTQETSERRRIRIDGLRYLSLAPRDPMREHIGLALESLGRQYGEPAFFRPRDIAFRVAGMGSLGVHRYVALVRGKGDPERNALIDFKHAVPSSAIAAKPRFRQPAWGGEAQRVVAIQDVCQAAAPAYLGALRLGREDYVVRELQPVEDKLSLPVLAKRIDRLDESLAAMARLSAYAQLRSASRRGAATVDELMDFGERLHTRPRPWIDAARAVDSANTRNHTLFRRAWRAGDDRLENLCAPAPA